MLPTQIARDARCAPHSVKMIHEKSAGKAIARAPFPEKCNGRR
jgi:hypothetical protein